MTRLSFLPLALLAGAALGLSGCVGGPASLGGEPPLTPTSRYALQVETGLDRIALAVHDDGLSANQNAALAALVERVAAGVAECIAAAFASAAFCYLADTLAQLAEDASSKLSSED
jgi:type IV pilus biogenesis protein CpaD/CtpE